MCACVDDRSAPAAGAPAPEGANQPPNLTSNRRLQQTQAQVDEVGFPHGRYVTMQTNRDAIEFNPFRPTRNPETLACFDLPLWGLFDLLFGVVLTYSLGLHVRFHFEKVPYQKQVRS